jgi:hypothetical protein
MIGLAIASMLSLSRRCSLATYSSELRPSRGLGQLRLGLFRGQKLWPLEHDASPAHILTAEEVNDEVLHLAIRQSLVKAVFDDDVRAVWETPSHLFRVARSCFPVHRTT